MSVNELSIRPRAKRNWLVYAVSVALTLLTLYVVFRGIDTRALYWLLARQDRGLLAAASLLIFLQILLGAERWRAILSSLLRGRSPPMSSVQGVFYSSIFFNCLPLGTVGGDIARVWLARKFSLSIKQLVMSVLIDRLIVIVALVILAAATLPKLAFVPVQATWFAATVIFCGVAGLLLLRPIERTFARWPNQRLLRPVLRAIEELRYMTGPHGLIALAFAVLSAACAALAAYCIARGIGIGITPLAMIAVMSLVIFLSALPISLAGWGIREISLVALLGLLGVGKEPALLLSVEFGLLTTLLSLPGGLIWLAMRPHRDAALSD